MPRRLRNVHLESRAARLKLTPQRWPYFARVERELHIGYRRFTASTAGTWNLRRYMGDGKYVLVRIATADDFSDADGVTVLNFDQAVQKARETLEEDAKQVVAPLKVSEAMEDYFAAKEGEGKNMTDARLRYAAHIKPKLGNKNVGDLTAKQLRDWRDELAKSPARVRKKRKGPQKFKAKPDDEEALRRRQSSTNRVLTILKAGLNHAFDTDEDGKVPNNQAWGRKLKPFRNVDAARPYWLSIDEAQRVVAACDPEFRPMVEAALQSGARYSTITRFRVRDFEPESNTIYMQRPKGGNAGKVIYLTDEGTEFFKRACAGRGKNDLIFTRKDGSQWKASQQLRPMKEAVKNARIETPITFHGLRHTWASHSMKNGVPAKIVANNLGHSDTRMVEKHYGHLAPSFEKDVVRKHAPRFGLGETNVVSFGGA
jgi:integrase